MKTTAKHSAVGGDVIDQRKCPKSQGVSHVRGWLSEMLSWFPHGFRGGVDAGSSENS